MNGKDALLNMIPPHANPFRVDRVSVLPYLHPDPAYVDAITDQFLKLRHAALVGPHGSGKSTLLRAIGQCLSTRGMAVVPLSLPGSATRREQQMTLASARLLSADAIVLFDGYEQLSPWRRHVLRRRGGRLLVTAHRAGRLPTLADLRPTEATINAILTELLGPSLSPPLTTTAQATFARHRGDVRATLFDLYDAPTGRPVQE